MPGDQPLILLEGVRKSFPMPGGEAMEILHGIDLSIASGECVALTGPSGSGKSTLMNIIGLLDTPTEGAYRFEGQDVAALSDATLARLRGRSIGFVFQSFNLLARVSALANVELPMRFSGEGINEARARELLGQMGLEGRMDHSIEKLSGGERQRVAIARALANRPALLLADEPTGNLDTKTGAAILDILLGLNAAGLTLIIVTHDPAVAARTGRILKMVDGRLEP